jgi:hypothetical protein
LLAVGYNLLLVVVKFVLAPRGFYEVNRLVARPDQVLIGYKG